MPNHVTNIVRIVDAAPSRIQEIFTQILDHQGRIDFRRIVPMPKILEGTTSPNTVNPVECAAETGYASWYEFCNAEWGTKWNAYEQETFYKQVGFRFWHRTWISNKWDKDHVYRCYPDRINKKRYKAALKKGGMDSIQFQTAWCIPQPIYERLSRLYPDVVFSITYADEDVGSNCGEFKIQDGTIIDDSNIAPPWRTLTEEEQHKWRKFACEVIGYEYNPEDYE